jgi:anaerobic dimethyl sulfoxide reductase subunit C (anchor subunit)
VNLREWALIAFTILAQMSVGSFVVLGVIHYIATRKSGMEAADRLSDRALLTIGPVLVLGMLASFAHLGNPLNAPRAVANLGMSWLSREIFFGVLFVIFGGVFALMQWRKIASFQLRRIIAGVAALIGLALVYSMGMVYMLETQPVWNTFATPVMFFAATFLLGALAVGAAFVATYAYVMRKDPSCAETQCVLLRDAVRWISFVSILVMGVELVVIPLHLAYLANSGVPEAVTSAALMFGQFGAVFALRLALVFIGAGLFAVFLYRLALSPGQEKTLGNLVYGAFALVLVAEVMGRFLFYVTQVQIGL